MNKEVESILTESQYGEVFEQLKNLPAVIKSIRNRKDILKSEKDNIVNELQHIEIELWEIVYTESRNWKEQKKLNNDETRKNFLETLKIKDERYQAGLARLSIAETELNKANALYEECTNKLKSYIAMKDLIVAKIELMNEFESAKIFELSEKTSKIKKEDLGLWLKPEVFL